MLPWQTAANAQQFGLDAQQQRKKMILFGTDGTNSPSQFQIPGTYVSTFGPDISTSTNPMDKAIVAGVAKYGPYGAFGVPTYAATDVVMKAIASVCKAGQTPSRSNVLAAIKTTNIPAAANLLGHADRVHVERQPVRQPRLSVPRQQLGQVHRDPAEVTRLVDHDHYCRDDSRLRSRRRRPRYCGRRRRLIVSNRQTHVTGLLPNHRQRPDHRAASTR